MLRITVGAACARYDDRAAAYLLLQHRGVALDVQPGDVLEGLGRELVGRLRPTGGTRQVCGKASQREVNHGQEVVAEPTGGQVMLCYGNLEAGARNDNLPVGAIPHLAAPVPRSRVALSRTPG